MTSRIVMLKPLLKKAIPLLAMIPLLGSCSLFQPKHKVIEYDEEVKLHDGSMIWVHIKRHYERSSGSEISNWFQGYEKGWGAKEVEISWDTGFPNVGRKSVFFDDGFEFIDKYQKKWYVSGGMTDESNIKKNGYDGIGNRSKFSAYLYVIDENGRFLLNKKRNELPDDALYNILDLRGLQSISKPPIELENKNLSWQQKTELHKNQNTYGLYFGQSIKTN